MINYKKIIEHNNVYKKKKFNFTCAVNRFSDMTTEEFVEKLDGLSRAKGVKRLKAEADSFSRRFEAILSRFFLPMTRSVSESKVNKSLSIDWRENGAVLGVRQQGKVWWIY